MKKFLWGLLLASMLPAGMQAAVVNGKVTKLGGDTAIADATVILRQGTGGNAIGVDTVLTNATGDFSFTALAAANYTVVVSKAGYNGSGNKTANATGKADTTIVLAITLQPLPAPGTVAGTIKKTPDSAVVAGARVILSRQFGGGATFTPDTMLTDAGGAYSFAAVPVGSNYTIAVTATGLKAKTSPAFAVDTAKTTTVNVTLDPPAAPGSVSGVVKKTPDSAVVAGARVILSRPGATFTPDTVLTDAAGAFSFASIAVNTGYTIAVSATGLKNKTSATFSVDTAKNTVVNVTLDPPAAPGSVSGVVRKISDSTTLIVGARVILSRQNGGFVADTVLTDAAGAFSFAAIPVNTNYTLTTSATGFVAKATQGVNVDTAKNTVQNIYLATPVVPGKVTGVVRKLPDSSVVAGANVILSRTGQGGGFVDTVVTDAEGKYQFDSVPVNTGYTVAVTVVGYDPASITNRAVTDGATTTVNITLSPTVPPTGVITGVVTDAKTKAVLAGAKVFLRARNATLDSTVSDVAGKYGFSKLNSTANAGTYSMRSTKDGYNTYNSRQITLAGGAADTADLPMTPTPVGTLVVYVGLDSATNPALTGAALVGLSGAREVAGTTAATGYATLANIVTGNYTVTATLAGYLAKAGSHLVNDSTQDTLRIYLVRVTDTNSKALTGVVRGGTDSAVVAGAKVTLRLGGGAGGTAITLETTTNAAGAYSFTGFAATITTGTLTVTMDGFITATANVPLTAAANTRNVFLSKPVAVYSLLGRYNTARNLKSQPGIFIVPNQNGARIDVSGRRLLTR